MRTRNILMMLIAMVTMSGTNVKAQQVFKAKKVLVAYFSWSGNTRSVANQIAELTDGKLFEIQTTTPYPEEYRLCTEVAKKEKEANARPELKTKVDNINTYDVIFVGYPNWWGTAPMAIWTFLENYNFSGKTVIPFCTHGGGGEQNCFKDFVKHTEKATIKKGFLINGGSANSARTKVEKWLHEIDH